MPRYMSTIEDHPILSMVVVAVPVLALAVGSAVFRSYMEARAFNRATGKNVSTWDALFIELRVQEGIND